MTVPVTLGIVGQSSADDKTARRAEIEARAAELAEQRRKARDEALAWQEELNARLAEEEARKAANTEKRKRKVKDEVLSGDEGSGTRTPADGIGGKKRKKKAAAGGKKSRKIRSKSEISTEEEVDDGGESEAAMSGADEDGEERGDGEEREDEEVVRARKAKSALEILKANSKVRYIPPQPRRVAEEDCWG